MKGKWQDLIKSPEYYNSYERSELSKIVSKLSAVANKRLKRMQDAGITYGGNTAPDAISGVRKFGAKGKTLGQLRSEYKRLSGFLESPLSSLSARKEAYYDIAKEERPNISRREAYKEYMSGAGKADVFNEVAKAFQVAREEGWYNNSPLIGINTDSKTVANVFRQYAYKAQQEGVEDITDYIRKNILGTDEEDEDLDIGTSSFF